MNNTETKKTNKKRNIVIGIVVVVLVAVISIVGTIHYQTYLEVKPVNDNNTVWTTEDIAEIAVKEITFKTKNPEVVTSEIKEYLGIEFRHETTVEYEGTIKLGYKAKENGVKISEEKKMVIVDLDDPEILSASIDPESKKISETKYTFGSKILNPADAGEVDRYLDEVLETRKAEVLKSDDMKTVKDSAQKMLENMYPGFEVVIS